MVHVPGIFANTMQRYSAHAAFAASLSALTGANVMNRVYNVRCCSWSQLQQYFIGITASHSRRMGPPFQSRAT